MTTVLSANRGIPKAPFIADIDAWMLKEENNSIEDVLNTLQEQLSKYKFMFAHLEQRQKMLQGKLPEIQKSIDAIELIVRQQSTDQDLLVEFEHADTLYVKACVPVGTTRVNLWLGANVMVEYNTDEALTLLHEKQTNTEKTIVELDQDLLYLKEQITTMEVTIARVYNWNVKKTRLSRSK